MKQVTINDLKPIIKRLTKSPRDVLTKVLVDYRGLSFTDLETFVTINSSYDLPHGLLDVNSLGITNVVSDSSVDEYPIFPTVETSNKVTISIKNLEMLLESSSKDETRLQLNSVAWIERDLVSVDGHILTRIDSQPVNVNKEGSIFPRTSLKELVTLSKKFKLNEVTLRVNGEYFKVTSESFTMFGRLIKREFPKYKHVIPTNTMFTINVTDGVKLSKVKDIINKISNCISLVNESGECFLLVKDTTFKQRVGTSNFTKDIRFNLKYLNFLTDLNSELKLNHELSPVMVTKGNITRIAMPMKQ